MLMRDGDADRLRFSFFQKAKLAFAWGGNGNETLVAPLPVSQLALALFEPFARKRNLIIVVTPTTNDFHGQNSRDSGLAVRSFSWLTIGRAA
jgi:hypothetical protein